MSSKDKGAANRLFLFLAAGFIASLVACNLIFRKFFSFPIFPDHELGFTLEQSVGLLPYPITFLITDIISEIFGRKKANEVVIAGLLASVFVLVIVTVADLSPAVSWSPVTDDQFSHVFGQTGIAVFASMMAYLVAQFIDVRIYHYWKKLTKGKKLWLRNNFSTITSQFFDTCVVLLLLCIGNEIPWEQFGTLLLMGFGFKVTVALIDTPFLYLFVYLTRARFKMKPEDEISLI